MAAKFRKIFAKIQISQNLVEFSQNSNFIKTSNFAKLKSGAGLILPLPTVHCQLFTAHCPLSTAHCLMSTVHCLPTVYSQLPSAHCPLSSDLTVYCPLFTIHYLLSTVYCLGFTAYFYWPLLTVHCSLPTVLCLLPIVHWPLSTVHAVYLLIFGYISFLPRWLHVENNLDLHFVNTDSWVHLIVSGQWAVNSGPSGLRIVGRG